MTNPTPIEAVRTDVTAFIGRTRRGPVNRPTRITSFAEYEQRFGGVWAGSTLSVAVKHFFDQSGAEAIIVRIPVSGADAQIVAALRMLRDAGGFNLLCIPPITRTRDVSAATWAEAAQTCKACRAVLIADAPAAWIAGSSALAGVQALRGALGDAADHAALFYPRLMPMNAIATRGNRIAPCGAVAGLLASNDRDRGVWKQAGVDQSVIAGDLQPSLALNPSQIDELALAGINLIRRLPDGRTVLWGARTLSPDPEWKYVSVRRYALFLEDSIDKGIEWAVFEPNGESLWANVRQCVEDFLFAQWQQGALQGTKPEQAFFVRCDRSTMTQDDIDNGRLVVLIGVATVRPAEFVIIRIGKRLHEP